MVELPRGDGRNGTWRPYLAHTPEPEFRPYWTAAVSCPNCKARMGLSLHTIAPDGSVSPSIGHPQGIPECGWHPAAAKLLGWEEVSAQPPPAVPNLETCACCGFQAHTIGGWSTWSGGPGIICPECAKARAAGTNP